jgi:two-component system, OmpR family, alkaline phosphatase synthesis response regulator PhoP
MTTILVVDDDASITEMLQAFLEDEGYQVVTAHNGQEGLDCLKTSPATLVLCDVMMPVLDGLGMCRTMQANPDYQAIPFVLMSALHAAIDPTSCHFAALLAKPFDLDDILQLIARLSSPSPDPGDN